jgi:hypothetical protein
VPRLIPGGFTVDDFTVDHQDRTATCPNGLTRPISRNGRRLPAEKETEGDPADAIVWDELIAHPRGGAERHVADKSSILPSRRVHRDRSSRRAGSRSARPGQRPLRRTRGPGTSFSSVRGADETTPSVSRSMVWSTTSLVMATALSRGHHPAAPGRPRRRGSPSVHRPQSPKWTIRINRAGGRRRVQQVSGCRRVRRQAEAR